MSFGNIITFVQSLFAAQTIEPEIVGFSGVTLDQAGNILAVIGNIICELIYFLVKWILAVVDFLQYFIQKLIGLDYWLQPGSKTIEGATDNDLLFQFLYNDTVQNVFRAMVGVFIILLVVFVIFSIVKTEWKYATGDGKGGNSKMQIFRSSFKAFLLVLVFPLVLTLGIISSNAILASLVGALNLDMAQTFGGTLFSIAAEPANKFRIYSSTDQRAPVSQRITFYVENSTGKTILFSNGTTYPEDKYCEYVSNYAEYLGIIHGTVGGGAARCTKYTVDTIFDVVVPRKEKNFSGYCVGLEVDGTTKYFLVKCTYAEKEGMYYYLRNILNGKVLSKNATTNANQGMTGNTVTELRKDLKDNIESTGKQSFISGADLHDFGSGAVIDAAYNTWGYASVYRQVHTFEESQSFKVVYSDVLKDGYELESVTNAKVSFNSNLVSPYFDGGQFGYVPKQAEYKVMADVIDFICNNNADLYMIDVTSSTIKWDMGSYIPDSKWIGGGSDRKVRVADAASGTVNTSWSNEVLPFVVAYSDLCSDADMGNQLYMANYGSSSELEGAIYVMCWKVISGGKTQYVPLINGRGYYDEATGQEFPTFKSEFYSNGYRGLVVAKGLLNNETTNQEYGEPTYITSGIDGVTGGIGGIEAPYYYELTENSSMFQYATAVSAKRSATDKAEKEYVVSDVKITNVDGAVTIDTHEKGGKYFKVVNADGSDRETSVGDIEGMTIHLKNKNAVSTTAVYAGLAMGYEDADNGTSGLNNNTKYLFVTSDGGYFVVSACKNASEYFIHEVTAYASGKATVGNRVEDKFQTMYLSTTLKVHYDNGTDEGDKELDSLKLNMFEPTTAKIDGKSVFKTTDMQYVEVSAISFAKSMYMNLTFNTSSSNLFSYSSDDGAKFQVAQPVIYSSTNTDQLQGTVFFDINYYDYTTGYVTGTGETGLWRYDLYNSGSEPTRVTEPIYTETFGINSSEFSWANDSVSYNLYDGDRYVATIYKSAGTEVGGIVNLITKSSYIMIEYNTYYNVRTQNTYATKDAFKQQSNNLRSSVVVSFNRDSLGASSFIFDFRISLLGKGRLKLIMSTYEVERDARKGYFYTSDSMAFDYFFDGEGKVNGNKIELKTFYVPSKVASPFGVGLWIMLISSALIIKILGTALWGIIKRFYEITLYYIAMPAVASTIVLDDGKRFQTSIQNPLIAKVLSTYGVILGINAFFVLLAPVRSMSNVFTAEDIATSGSYFLKALSNLPLFGSFELTAKLLNAYTYILFLLVAFTMINDLPQLITRIMGTGKDGGDVVKSGADTKKQVKQTMNEAGKTLSGQGLMDGASEAIGMAKGMIPGSAIVSAGAEKLGELFGGNKGGGKGSHRDDEEGGDENGATEPQNAGVDQQEGDQQEGQQQEGEDQEGSERNDELDPENDPMNAVEDAVTGEDGVLGEVANEIITEGGGEAVKAVADAVVGEGAGEAIAAATEKAPDLESTFRQIRMDSFGNDLISPEIRKTFTENMTQEEFAAAKQSTVENYREKKAAADEKVDAMADKLGIKGMSPEEAQQAIHEKKMNAKNNYELQQIENDVKNYNNAVFDRKRVQQDARNANDTFKQLGAAITMRDAQQKPPEAAPEEVKEEVKAEAQAVAAEGQELSQEEAEEYIEANEADIAENNEFIAMAEQSITEEGTKAFASSDKIDELVASGELDASYVNTHDWGAGKKVKAIADGVVDKNGVSLAEKFGVMTSSEVKQSISSVEQSKEDIAGFQAENAAKQAENDQIRAGLEGPKAEEKVEQAVEAQTAEKVEEVAAVKTADNVEQVVKAEEAETAKEAEKVVEGVVAQGLTETGKKGVDVPAVADNKKPEGPVDPTVATEEEKAARASLKQHKAELGEKKQARKEAQVEYNIAEEAVENAQESYDAIVSAEAGVTEAQSEYDEAVKTHGADSPEAQAAKEKLDAAVQHRDETLEMTGDVEEAKGRLEEAQAYKEEKKGALDTAKAEEQGVKDAITKDKQDIENSMTPERKMARRNQITNTIMSGLGTVGTIAATIAGGPIAGILVHKAAKHLKSAAPGVVNAISHQFGEFKKADGWGKAAMISGMAMKGAAIAAGGVLAGQAIAFAAPALAAVGAATGALGVPLWAIGAAGLAGVASKKMNQLTSGYGSSYVNAGNGTVVRAGAGTNVPPVAAQNAGKPGVAAQAGGKPGEQPKNPLEMTKGEAEAREKLAEKKAALSDRKDERKAAEQVIKDKEAEQKDADKQIAKNNKQKAKLDQQIDESDRHEDETEGDYIQRMARNKEIKAQMDALDADNKKQEERKANAQVTQEEKDAVTAAKDAEKQAKQDVSDGKKEVEENMSPERKAARRENITNTVMSVIGTAGTVVGTIAGGPIVGLLIHKTSKHLKAAAPGVVNAVSQQFGEFKKADGWKKAEILSGMAMKGAAIAAGGVLAGQAIAFAAPVLGAVNTVTSALGAPLWALGAAGLSGVASKKLNQLTGGSGSSYVNAGKGTVVRAGTGANVPQLTAQNAGQAGVAGGKAGSAQMTKEEAEAREKFAQVKAEHGDAKKKRKNAEQVIKDKEAEQKDADKKIARNNKQKAKLDQQIDESDRHEDETEGDYIQRMARNKQIKSQMDALDADNKKQEERKANAQVTKEDKAAVDEAKETEKGLKEEKTKAKKEIEANMSPERKTERAQRIANTIIGGLGTAGTIAATIAGGPIAGLVVHRTAKNIKRASSGVIQSAGSKFGQLKAADGWGKAAIISGMVMKGAAITAGGLAIGSAVGQLATAMPFLGTALTNVSNFASGTLKTPLWMFGALGVSKLASNKFAGARSAGSNYVNTGRGAVVRAGTGVSVPQGVVTNAGQAGVAGGKAGSMPPMTKAEAEAREKFEKAKEEHGDAKKKRKNAEQVIKDKEAEQKDADKKIAKNNKQKAKLNQQIDESDRHDDETEGDYIQRMARNKQIKSQMDALDADNKKQEERKANAQVTKEDKAAVDEAKETEKGLKEEKTKAKKEIEANMSPERKAARRENITNTIMSGLGTAGTVAATIAGGPIAGLLFHRTAKHLKAAAPGVVHAVSDQFGEFKKADGWRRAEIISGMAMKGAALAAGGIAIGSAVGQLASVIPAPVLAKLGKVGTFAKEELGTPLWMFGALGAAKLASNKFGNARRTGTSYVSNPNAQYVRSGAGVDVESTATRKAPFTPAYDDALVSARAEYADGLTVANGPNVVYIPQRVTGLKLSSSAVAARRKARGQADNMNINANRSSSVIARDKYNLDKINDTAVVADKNAALANVVRNQTNTKVGMQVAARSIARYGAEGDTIGAQIYAGINGTDKQPGLLTPEMKEQLVLAVLSKIQVERYKQMGEADQQKMIDSYKVVGGMKANGEIGFEVAGRDGSRFVDKDVTADVLSQMMSSGKISDANINLSTKELGHTGAVEAQLAKNLALGVDYSSDLSKTANLTDSNVYRTVMNSRKYDDVVSEGILRHVTADPNSDLYRSVSKDLGIGDPSDLDNSATKDRVIEQISRMRNSEGINSINSIPESEYSGKVAEVMKERAMSGDFNVTAWDYASAATKANEVANIEALKDGSIREELAAAETRLSRKAVQANEPMVLLNTFATAKVDNKATIVNDMLNSGKFANISANDDKLLQDIVSKISADDDSETATRLRTAGSDELKLALKKAIMLKDVGSDRAGLNADMLAKYLKGGDDIDTALIQEMAKRGINNGSVKSAVGVLQTSLTSTQRNTLLDAAAKQGTLGLTVGENRNLKKMVKGTDIDVDKLSYFEASALLHKNTPENVAKFIELEAKLDKSINKLVEAQGHLISNDAVKAQLERGGDNASTAALFAGNYSGKMQMLTEADQEQIKLAAAKAEIDNYNKENPDSRVEYAVHSSLADLAKAVQGNPGLAARMDIAGIDAVDAANKQRLALGMGDRIKMYAADIQADPSLYNKARSAFRASNPGKDLDEVDSMTRNNYLANEFVKSLSPNDKNLVNSRRNAIDLDYISKMTGITRDEAKALMKEAAKAGVSIDSLMLEKGLMSPVDAFKVDSEIMKNVDGREFTELYNEAKRENYNEELYGVNKVKYNIMKNSPNATPAVDVDAMNQEQRSRYEFTRNFLQQMNRTGENPNMLANTFRNTTLYDNDRVVEEMAAIQIEGQAPIDPKLSTAEKKKRLSNEQINAYLNAHEEYKDILTSYAAADVTRTMDAATKEKNLYDLASKNPELDAKVRAELRAQGKQPGSGNKADYNAALAVLMQRDEAFKNAMYSKLTDTFDPGAKLSHKERVAFFENNRALAQGPQGNTMRSVSEWLSKYIASEGKDTGNIVLTNKVNLPENSSAYANWNKYLDAKIAEIKSKKGDYAQMSAADRTAEIAKLQAKKIGEGGDAKQQEKNKRDAFSVGDFTELYSKGAKVDVIHSKAVRAVIAKNGMSSNGEFDVLTGKRITSDVENNHKLQLAEAQNVQSRYKAAAAMRTSKDFGENFSAMATSYIGKQAAVEAAKEARNAFLAKYKGTASKTGAAVTATTKYEDLTAAQQKYLRDLRQKALEQRISSRVVNASRNVRYDREMKQFDSWTQSQGLVPEVVRYTDGSKRFTQQTSKTTDSGSVSTKSAAQRRADQIEYLSTRDDKQNVENFNSRYRGNAAQYASEIRKQVYGTSAQKAIEELISSKDPISGKSFSAQALSVQKSKVEKALQDLYARAENRVNSSYKYIPSATRPYIGSSFSLAAGAKERDLQKSKLSDFRSAFESLSANKSKASYDALYSSLSASIKNSFMNTMNSKERAAFNAQSDAAKFAKLEQYIAKNYASLSKHVKVNNFYHTNTAALTDLSGTSVKRTVSSADNRAIMKSLRPSETVRYNDILTRHEVAIKNVHAEESHYRKLAEKFASAGPKEREVIRKQMTDSATRLTTYERTVKIIEEEKRSFEQKIEARRSAGDIIRAAAGVGSNKNENVLNNYNMRTKGPHGRPIHPGGPLDRPMNMILLRFMERYKNQIQSMYKTEIYQQSQAVLAYTKGKANKLSNDIARTIADNRQLRKFLKGEIAKLENSIKASDVALRNAMSNDIGRLEEAENEMKTRLSSLEIDLSSMEKKIGTATTAVRPTAKPAAKPTTKK